VTDIRSVPRGYDAAEVEDSERRLSVSEHGDELTIVGVRRSDASTYSCRAFNTVGAATRTYTLVVQGSHNNRSLLMAKCVGCVGLAT